MTVCIFKALKSNFVKISDKYCYTKGNFENMKVKTK